MRSVLEYGELSRLPSQSGWVSSNPLRGLKRIKGKRRRNLVLFFLLPASL